MIGRIARLGVLGAAALAAAVAPGTAQQPSTPTQSEPVQLQTLDTPEPTDSVTIEQAVELAVKNSPGVAQSRGDVTNAEWSIRSAWGAFLPSLSGSTGASVASTERFNPTTNTTVTGSSDSYNAGLSASLPIFTGGRRTAQLRQAKAETKTANASLVEQRFAVALSAKQAYYDELAGEELIGVAEARMEQAKEGLDAAQRRAQVGSATRSDVLRSQLELTQARKSLLDARNQRNSAALALGRLVGTAGPVAAKAVDLPDPTPLPVSDDELRQIALSSTPAVRTAEAAVTTAEAGAQVARAQYFPSLNLSSGYDWFNTNPTFNDARGSWSLRLGLSYPIFNGFQREQSAARANVTADVARTRLDDARRVAGVTFENQLAALRLAEDQITLAKQALEVAQEDMRVQAERYRLGASTILDRITSQINLVQAETDLVSARHAYQIARAQLEATVGREL